MAAVVTLLNRQIPIRDGLAGANEKLTIREGTVAMDSSYAGLGGEALLPGAFDLESITYAWFAPTSGYVFEYDYSGHKLKAYHGDNNGAAGPLIEVPDATNLAALAAVRFLVVGPVPVTI